MPACTTAPVEIHTNPQDVPSIPAWFAELILFVRHFSQRGLLDAIAQKVHLARGRAGHYDVIDFVALLLGYALSHEPTLEAFFDRLQPFARPFMALFGREQVPHRSTLSRFLADVDVACLDALRQLFDHDLGHHGATGALLGGLFDHCGHRLLVFDIDATRQAARQRALVTAAEFPSPRRRMAKVCAAGYRGRKRGEVVRTRTTVLQIHTQQWLGTFSGPGNGDYRAELDAAIRSIGAYLQAKGLAPVHALLRLDGFYGTASPLARIQHAGLGFVTRGRDYHVLDHPTVQTRLRRPPDIRVQHPETQVCRELFDVGYLMDWLEPVPEGALTCRVIIARQTAPDRVEAITSGKLVGSSVYELFLTSAPARCVHANEVLDLYYQRGGFERVLSDEDTEQDPDRWCSCTPRGQEFWQILSQWVWNTRLELGTAMQEPDLRQTTWADAVPSDRSVLELAPPDPECIDELGEAVRVESYGPLEVAREWGRASGRLSGQAFEILEDGTLRCPAEKILRPQEQRKQADGTLRIVYRAKNEDCRSCSLAHDCLGRQMSSEHPRRVSAVRKRRVEAGGTKTALVHEDATMRGSACEAQALVWCDLPGYRIRQVYVERLRQQRVRIVTLQADSSVPGLPEAPRMWTRAERAHRRLSWAVRLARNRCAGTPVRYAVTVFGVAPALAAYLGLSPDPPG